MSFKHEPLKSPWVLTTAQGKPGRLPIKLRNQPLDGPILLHGVIPLKSKTSKATEHPTATSPPNHGRSDPNTTRLRRRRPDGNMVISRNEWGYPKNRWSMIKGKS